MGESLLSKVRHTERKKSFEGALSKLDATTVVLALSLIFTVGLAALDLYSHPHQGMADLERRKFLFDHIGQIAKHLGNFTFTAAASISAVFMKHLGEFLTEHKVAQKLARVSSLSISAGILAVNALVEVFPDNNDLIGDLSMVAVAFILGKLSTELAVARFKQAEAKAQ
jgi:hypothetical protein